MKFVNPKNDVAFRRIFGSEDKTEVLIGFLNAILGLQGQDAIQSIQIRNPYQTPNLEFEKLSILDVYATDHRGFTFIVEMQVAYVASILKRFTYYVAKEYAGQISSGQDYRRLTPMIFIGIFDFVLQDDKDKNSQDDSNESCTEVQNDESVHTEKGVEEQKLAIEKKHNYLSCHQLLDIETHENRLKDMAFYFIELPRFTKKEHELVNILDKWVYFIRHAKDLDVIPDHVYEPDLQTAYELADQFGWEREDLRQYEYRSMRIQDKRGALTFAKWEGREEGREEGRAEGEEAAALKIAHSLLSIGLPIEQIMQTTELSAEQIRQ